MTERCTTPPGDGLAQAVSVIHDLLHKADIGAAHTACHRALGIEDGLIDPLGRKFFREFDVAFNTACRKNNVSAVYIIFDNDDPTNPRKMRLLTGGETFAVALLKRILAAGQQAVAERLP